MRMLALLSILVTLAAGCATVFEGKTQKISIQSTPAGATVLINGTPIGQTPISTLIEKKTGQVLIVRKEGYKDFSATMDTKITGWFWGNIICCGLLGSTTDAATGSMHEYAPNMFLVTLEPDNGTPMTKSTGKSRNDKVREYIVLSYSSLSSEISVGRGNYLDSLLSQLEITADRRDATIRRLAALVQAFPDIVEFSDQVVAAFSK